MQLTHQHRKQIVAAYCILFYVLMLYKWLNGLFLYQLQPFIFSNRFDMLTWLVMQTGIHQTVIQSKSASVFFDAAFYTMPAMYWLAFVTRPKLASAAGIIMLLVNWVYVQVFTLFPGNSIEGHIAWLLFPLLFITKGLRTFYFLLHGLRYFFLYFFASAGVWKLVQGGVFNIDQMRGVLMYQHKEFLVSSAENWYSTFIYWWVNHRFAGYLLYLAGTLSELFFITGFFTKKYDRWLVRLFLLFLLMDVLVMRIHYWETLPFIITLMYSRFYLPPISVKTNVAN